ncbi:NAD(P)-binding domain-containing protein [Amycolatopsis vancoresmycina]|uniref:Pyrroline-5-carboxylate reductase n=1 Tax=Amycolatopsis vancoresmycina DSM 44592 TaxID=1292037 RepID=R1FXA2_9PSEU|nr:NAD(P)-binding domain-containing protein [Amycolatopsis vancoresmycina]EOD63947.1 pyrroline-5-carboxylate reductase [Amycolatopsis vancoresmycina DSM 44592]
MQPYGFVGTGELTAAVVEGLSAGSPAPPPVFLSPRNQRIAHDLAARFPNVTACGSNQEVLDRATAVVIAVRPQITRDVLEELTFRPDHVVVSAVAAVSLAELRDHVAPAERIVRAIPLPTASRRASCTALYPDDPVARTLFESVGEVVVPENETTLATFSAATATFAAHLDQLATIAAWMAAHGVRAEDANAYVAHVFGELGNTLREAGVPDHIGHGLDAVLTRLTQ